MLRVRGRVWHRVMSLIGDVFGCFKGSYLPSRLGLAGWAGEERASGIIPGCFTSKRVGIMPFYLAITPGFLLIAESLIERTEGPSHKAQAKKSGAISVPSGQCLTVFYEYKIMPHTAATFIEYLIRLVFTSRSD